MIFQRKNLFLVSFLVISFSGSSQILNDSTQNIYGPKSSRYFLEEDLYNSIDTLYYLDTAITAFHRYTFPERYNYYYQDLGNKGSAIQPLFYKPPANIGFRSGYDVYSLYFDDLLDMKFYDTKSPYSKFYYVQGGRGLSHLETELSRNVNPNWNLGISFNRLSANPQILYDARPLDPETDHYSYSAYTAYRTPNKKYRIAAYYRRMNHRVREPGGVVLTQEYFKENKFSEKKFFDDYEVHEKELSKAMSGDLRNNYHLYHEFNFSSLVGIYHTFDYSRQETSYEDKSSPYSETFYPNYYIDNTQTPRQNTIFKIFKNDVGLKGELNEFKYRIYYRRRNFFVDNFYLNNLKWQIEDVAGAAVAVRFSERSILHLEGELLANSSLPDVMQANDYKVNFSFENRYINAVFSRTMYSPTYLQQVYFGNHHSWDNIQANTFGPSLADDLYISTRLPLGIFEIIPHVKASRIYNYIYYAEAIQEGQRNFGPKQSDSPIEIFTPGLDLNIKLGNFYFRNNFTYNYQNKTGKDVLRVPQMIANSLIYFQKPITKKGHFLQFGLDINWRTSYFADKYMPSIQQFYIQNEYEVQPYTIVNFYGAMKINRTRVFARVSHLNEGFGGVDGYLVRPYYFGFRRVLDVGVHWMFFD